MRPMTTKKPSGRSHGFRHKSRSVMTKRAPRGVSFLLREYSAGDRALIIIDPRQHKGLPHRRYHGKVGTVKEAGRRAVTLDVRLGEKMKTLITRYDHIKPFGV
ncbi:ribosomal protein L21E [Cenarchaeum symbiosum A]|uniref:Large ribosomal subunit protein eL21 n=1 Tax=Cenarchaeum symbiosum (strain A) TaxID=414004 RepID=A0RUT3_CENSY|nr:ribosomal protein L21E [Cenarchaeum symbiosum A]